MADDVSTQLDDTDIAIRMMEGDEDALRLFLRRNLPKVKSYLTRKCGHVLSEEEIDGAINDAAAKMWHSIDTYDESKGTLRAWFSRIAQNKAIDAVRREAPYVESREDLNENDPKFATDPRKNGGDEPREDTQMERDFREITMKKLTPLERRVMDADLLAGGSADLDWLADRLGSTRGSVTAARCKGQKKVRDEMWRRGHFRDNEDANR